MEITKWEYKNTLGNQENLNQLGIVEKYTTWLDAKQGWEAVGIEGNGVLMKRPCGRLQVIEKVNGVPINQEQDRSDGVER